MSIKLNTGKVEFEINFDNGDKEKIYFNPNDPDLFFRFLKFEERVKEKTKDFIDIEMLVNGKPKEEKFIETFKVVNKIICEELDVAFGNDVSSIVFKHCNPFAIVEGEYFIVQFIKAIKPIIENQNKKANKEMEKKMAKYTEKYAIKK